MGNVNNTEPVDGDNVANAPSSHLHDLQKNESLPNIPIIKE
jgi:hypothetical protein